MLRGRLFTVAATVVSPLAFALSVQLLPAAGPGRAAPAPVPASPSPRGATLWVNPASPAALAVTRTRPTRPADAVLLRKIASKPQATWLGEWLTPASAQAFVAQRTATAAATGTVPVFVLYAIPFRDCGSYSAGGQRSAAAYKAWADGVSRGLRGRRAIVVVEPDSLPSLDCLSPAARTLRLSLVRYAVDAMRRNPGVSVYLDAGNAYWQSPQVMAQRLTAAGVARVRGITVNAGNFDTTASEIAYAKRIGQLLGRRLPVVVDTSRNGNGRWTGPLNWCNPPGRALGQPPTTTHPDPLVDALLWIKTPGLSDGTCKGGPQAGLWWQSYALTLARNAGW